MSGLIPNTALRVWRGDLCLLILAFELLLIGAESGCSLGRVAIRVIALWQIFSTLSSIGSKLACASSVSVGVVLSPPVTASAPALCVDESFLIVLTDPFLLPFAFFPCIGVHQT